MDFNPQRLTFARNRRGFTKKMLAEKLGVSHRTIIGYERSEYVPCEEAMSKISTALKFPSKFFFEDDIEIPDPAQISFRAVSKLSALKRNAATHTTSIAFNLMDWIEQKFHLPEPNLLDLRDTSPEEASIILRQHWNLGNLSIKNIIHLLEVNGIKVFSINEKTLDLDAFSLWRNNTPFIFLNMQKSMERTRFDVAHELGHLVLHKHGSFLKEGQIIEKEANNFAAAFLMPKASVMICDTRNISINSLLVMKKKWIVSISALANRLYKLGLLTDWHYRVLCIQMAQKKYFTNEPEPAEKEYSAILKTIFRELWKEGISKDHIASFLNIYTQDVEEIVFGLTPNVSHIDPRSTGQIKTTFNSNTKIQQFN